MIKKLNFIFDRKQKIDLFINAILALGAALFELLGVTAIVPLISVMLTPSLIDENKWYKLYATTFHIQSLRDFVTSLSLLLILVYVVKNLYLIFRYRVSLNFNYRTRKNMAMRLMKYYLNQDYLYHVKHSAAELQRNINDDVNAFNSVVLAILNIMVEIFTCGCLIVFLMINDFYTTIILAGVFAVIIVVIFVVYKKQQVRAGAQARVASKDLIKWLMQSLGGIKELKVLNREKFFFNKYDESYNSFIHVHKKYNMLTACPKYLIEMIAVSGLLITIISRINMNVDITSFATGLSAFALAAIRMLPSFNRLTEYISIIMYNKASVNAIYEDISEARLLNNDFETNAVNTNRLIMEDSIEVKDISFKYPEGDKKVFDKANLVIKRNKSIAFIGESGAGKTTLADIILGLLKPDEGKVLIDGKDIYDDINSWHKAVGYIPQMIYLMDDTIRNNIVFGHDIVDDDMIWKALKDAQIDDFVRGLSKGLDTQIGDRGVRLSGGQRQRLGIARALYTQPQVLFLDEATSALDNETEAAVMESINYLQGKTTLVIIAHRLSTISNCDEIYEVGNGTIVAKDKSEILGA